MNKRALMHYLINRIFKSLHGNEHIKQIFLTYESMFQNGEKCKDIITDCENETHLKYIT